LGALPRAAPAIRFEQIARRPKIARHRSAADHVAGLPHH
jgi:hypothetical protein